MPCAADGWLTAREAILGTGAAERVELASKAFAAAQRIEELTASAVLAQAAHQQLQVPHCTRHPLPRVFSRFPPTLHTP